MVETCNFDRIFETLRQSEEFSSTDADKQADVKKQDAKVII